MPGFQLFSGFFLHHFIMAKLANSSIRVKYIYGRFQGVVFHTGCDDKNNYLFNYKWTLRNMSMTWVNPFTPVAAQEASVFR